MNLYVLRHGEALDGLPVQDSQRPLSDRGLKQAAAVGRFLAEQGIQFDHVLCSPLLRARQSAETVGREIGTTSVQTTDTLQSSSDPHDLLNELRKLNGENVLIVGHEPHLGRTISLLLGSEDQSRVEMKTCSLACVIVRSAPRPGSGVLRWLIPSGATLK